MATARVTALATRSIRRSGNQPTVQRWFSTHLEQPSIRAGGIFQNRSGCLGSASLSSRGSSQRRFYATPQIETRVKIPIDGKTQEFSSILLRDLCNCPACVHEHTRQRLFSTADIPSDIGARSVEVAESSDNNVQIHWSHDIPGFDSHHSTTIDIDTLRKISKTGVAPSPSQEPMLNSNLWDASSHELPDFTYDAYMGDDATLLQATEQLHTHGLVFITGVPGVEKSVSTIAERIGPVKDTFYGYTWDVRTVPKAINAAFTSGDLGFHTDLLYFENPPHVQLLHCIESSSTGGASVFADAFKSALDLYAADEDAFNVLATVPVNYHYEHPNSNIYRTTKPVIEMRPLRIGNTTYSTLSEFLQAWESNRKRLNESADAGIPNLEAVDCLEKINWGPPFLAPFSLDPDSMEQARGSTLSVQECLNDKVDKWHAAAKKFSALLQRPGDLHERLMQPGECVLFNNTRVLHARKAFDANDAGKARWLRGTYVDKDPYLSNLRVLRHGLLSGSTGNAVEQPASIAQAAAVG